MKCQTDLWDMPIWGTCPVCGTCPVSCDSRPWPAYAGTVAAHPAVILAALSRENYTPFSNTDLIIFSHIIHQSTTIFTSIIHCFCVDGVQLRIRYVVWIHRTNVCHFRSKVYVNLQVIIVVMAVEKLGKSPAILVPASCGGKLKLQQQKRSEYHTGLYLYGRAGRKATSWSWI